MLEKEEKASLIRSYAVTGIIPKYLKDNIYEILDIIDAFIIIIYRRENAKGLDQVVDLFKATLKKEYEKIQERYFLENKININYLDIDINYDLSIKDFLEELSRIKKEFNENLNRDTKKEILLVIKKFKDRINYNALKNDIKALASKYQKEIIADFGNKNNKLVVLKSDLGDLFDNHQKYLDLKNKDKKIDDLSVTKKVEELKEHLQDKDFIVYYNEVEKIVNNYLEFINNKDIVIELYNKLFIKMQDELSKCKPNDYLKINNILNLYKSILEIIKKYKNGSISLDSLLLLDNLTFSDSILDTNVIKSVTNNLNYVNTNDIYLRKNIIGPIGIFYKDNEEYRFAYPYITGNKEDKINLNNISNLISLENYYKKAVFEPYKGIIQGSYEIIVLYEYQDITISISNNSLRVDYKLRIKNKELVDKNNYLKYYYFDFLCLELRNILEDKLKDYENKHL